MIFREVGNNINYLGAWPHLNCGFLSDLIFCCSFLTCRKPSLGILRCSECDGISSKLNAGLCFVVGGSKFIARTTLQIHKFEMG
jgi:hypothetical protein